MKNHRSIWSLSFFPILLTYFTDSFGQAVIFPIFTSLLLRPHLLGTELPFLHKTALLLLLTASFPLARIFGSPILGELSDRIGRKKVFIMTVSGAVIGYFLSGVGIHLEKLSLLWSGRLIAGFFAGNLTLCLAAISDISHSREERVRHFGIVGTLGSLGFVFAILSGSLVANSRLSDFYHPEFPLFIASFLSVINFFLITLFFKESHLARHWTKSNFFKGLKTALSAKGIFTIILIYFFFTLCWGTSLQFLSTYLTDVYQIASSKLPYFFVSAALLWAFSNFVINPLLTRFFSPAKTLFLCMIFLTCFLFLTLIPEQPLSFFIFYFACAVLAAAICWTNGLAVLSLLCPQGLQGTLLGINQSVAAFAFVLGPSLGELITHFDANDLYFLTGSFSLIAALLLAFHIRRNYV